ncbi:MAG: ribosome maturation factor RimP [Campylobacteraceae bacterium 4484_4]|nr:MAG: ribosome maturation factor RimP [Campylobacteraceae bacterium 4484_4]
MDRETLQKLIEESGAHLYDTEIVTEDERRIFRIYITAPGGVTLDKCEEITKILSPILDLEPPMEGEYFLEVSSPGIERKLTKPEHFAHSEGELVKLKLIDGEKIKAKILDLEGDQLRIRDKTNKEERTIPLSQIQKAKTYFEW